MGREDGPAGRAARRGAGLDPAVMPDPNPNAGVPWLLSNRHRSEQHYQAACSLQQGKGTFVPLLRPKPACLLLP